MLQSIADRNPRSAFLLLALIPVSVFPSCRPSGKLERRADSTLDFVYVVLPSDMLETERAVHRLVSDRRALPAKFSEFSPVSATNPIFPSDSQLRAHLKENVALERYVSWSYWHSEYVLNNSPIDFQTNLIIHLEPDRNGTRVEIIEYLPTVKVGKCFWLLGHEGPGFYDNIYEVHPTTIDRLEMLQAVAHSVGDR